MVNAASFLAVLLALIALRLPSRPVTVNNGSAWAGVVEGLRYTAGSRPLVSLLLLAAVVSALAVPYNVLLPVLVQRVFNGDAWLNGLLFTASGLGALAGGLFLASRHSVLGLLKHVWLLPLGSAAALIGLSWIDSPWLAAPMVFLIGLTVVMLLTTCNMTLQSIVPDRMRGRVLSLYALIFLGTNPIGSLVAGSLTDYASVHLTLLVFGATLATVALVFGLTLAKPLFCQAKAQFDASVQAAAETAEAA
jgi:MFS family permease